MRFKVWFEEFLWNHEVYMFNYDVKVKIWNQVCFQDFDYEAMKWYDMWKAISHIMMMFMKSMIKWKVNSHFMIDPCDQWCSRANPYDYEP